MATVEDYKKWRKDGAALERQADKYGAQASAASDRLWAAQSGSAEAKAARAEQREYERLAAETRGKAWALFEKADAFKDAMKKKPNPKKAPSAKQLAARRKFAAAAKARSKAAKSRKKNATIIKAKRVTIVQLRAKAKENPALDILREAKATKRGNQQGWLLGKEFIPKGKGTKKLPGGALFDTNAGFVYRRVENPKKKPAARKKNIAGFMQDGVFHPIRSGQEQRTTKSGTRTFKSKKAYKPSKVGEKFTYSPKKSAKRASQTKRMKAATAQRKATTTRLASRSLQRSVPLKAKRRNPESPQSQKLQDWRGYPKQRDIELFFPEGTPNGLYKLAPLLDMHLEGASFKVQRGKVWICASTRNDRQIYFGSKTGEPMTALPRGPIAKVTRIDYGPVLKKHLYKNSEEFKHNFGEENGKTPTLWSDGKGGVFLKGGDYYITPEGIRN